MHRFLPLILIVLAIVGALNYLPIKRFVAYKLNISGDTTTSCCNVAEIIRSTGQFEESANVAIFNNIPVDYPKTSLAQAFQSSIPDSDSQVLGTTNSAGDEKWIDVSLSEQRLRAYEGDKVVIEFPISSGLWSPTPTGNFSIWYKTRTQRMKGGSVAMGTYYDLPNVPHNMFFNGGYAIHGAYWHNNFGHPMSHGCVNSPLAQVAQLFEWTGPVVPAGQNVARATDENPGTRVYVH